MPALEAVARTPVLRSFSGIVNGTCNFICDELANGRDFDEAVRRGAVRGFCRGRSDARYKRRRMRAKVESPRSRAFGISLSTDEISVEGITDLDAVV
jgi:hypothetical protein